METENNNNEKNSLMKNLGIFFIEVSEEIDKEGDPITYDICNMLGNSFLTNLEENKNDELYGNNQDNIAEIFTDFFGLEFSKESYNLHKEAVDNSYNLINNLIARIRAEEGLKISGQEIDYNTATLEQIQELLQLGGNIGEYVVEKFALQHKWQIADFLLEHNATISSVAILNALNHNDTEAALFLQAHGALPNEHDVLHLLNTYNIIGAQWLLSHGGQIHPADFEIAALNNNPAVERLLAENGAKLGDHTIEKLAVDNNFEQAELLVDYGSISDVAVLYAVIRNNYNAAEWLLDHNAKIRDHDVSILACDDNFIGAEWLMGHGAKIDIASVYRCEDNIHATEFLKEQVNLIGDAPELIVTN